MVPLPVIDLKNIIDPDDYIIGAIKFKFTESYNVIK